MNTTALIFSEFAQVVAVRGRSPGHGAHRETLAGELTEFRSIRRIRRAVLGRNVLGHRADLSDGRPDRRIQGLFVRHNLHSRGRIFSSTAFLFLFGFLLRGNLRRIPFRGYTQFTLAIWTWFLARRQELVLAPAIISRRSLARAILQSGRRAGRRGERFHDRHIFLPHVEAAPEISGSQSDCTAASIGARLFSTPCQTAATTTMARFLTRHCKVRAGSPAAQSALKAASSVSWSSL